MASLLFVDDDEDLAESLKDLFETLGYEADVVTTGLEALELLKARSFTMIFLDCQLPDISGSDLCRRFRDDGGSGVVLMMTGARDAVSLQDCLDAGADDVLIKPFNVDAITEKALRLLNRERP